MNFFYRLSIILFLFFLPSFVKAECLPPPCDIFNGECLVDDGMGCYVCETCPVEIPIDGGASLLLIAGGAYGINKIRKNKNEKKIKQLLK